MTASCCQAVRTKILCTSFHGLPQRRERFFLIAVRLDSLNPSFDLDNIWPEDLPEAGAKLPLLLEDLKN